MTPAAPNSIRAGRVLVALTALAALAFAHGQADPLVGTFGDGRLTLVLQAAGQGRYAGRLVLDGNAYPLTATGSARHLTGSFDAPNGSFAFTAELTDEVVTLSSGASTYRLTRSAPEPTPSDGPTAGALAPGTRVSYEFTTVSHPGTSAHPQSPGSGAAGVVQYDVVHRDERLCVMTAANYLRPPLGGPLVASPSSGLTVVSRDGTCPDVWWPPERLRTYAAAPESTQQVERGPFQLQNGDAIEALFVRHDLEGSRFSRVWDLTSGLMLAYTDGTGPTPAPAAEPTSSSTSNILAVRLVERPWDARQPLAGPIRELTRLRYRVTLSMAQVGFSAPPVVHSSEVVYEVEERHPSFLVLRPPGGAPTDIVVLAGNGSLYLPPAAAAILQPGQRVDQDPITGATQSVARVDAGGVVLETRAPTFMSRSTYDPTSGLLRNHHLEYGDGVTTTTIELELLDAR